MTKTNRIKIFVRMNTGWKSFVLRWNKLWRDKNSITVRHSLAARYSDPKKSLQPRSDWWSVKWLMDWLPWLWLLVPMFYELLKWEDSIITTLVFNKQMHRCWILAFVWIECRLFQMHDFSLFQNQNVLLYHFIWEMGSGNPLRCVDH